jgi:hypothetical protein
VIYWAWPGRDDKLTWCYCVMTKRSGFMRLYGVNLGGSVKVLCFDACHLYTWHVLAKFFFPKNCILIFSTSSPRSFIFSPLPLLSLSPRRGRGGAQASLAEARPPTSPTTGWHVAPLLPFFPLPSLLLLCRAVPQRRHWRGVLCPERCGWIWPVCGLIAA